MSCLIVMSWKQRLLQVGTCVIPRRRLSFAGEFRSVSVRGRVTAKDVRSPLSLPMLEAGIPNGADRFSCCGGGCTRNVATLSSLGGPALAAFARKEVRIINRGDQPLPKLLGGTGEIEGDNLKEKVMSNIDKNVISIPVHLEKRLERFKAKQETKRAIQQQILDNSRKGRKAQVVIYCKHKDKNHYQGQSYDKKKEIPVASEGWRHWKAAGDFFTLFPGVKKDGQSSFFMEGTESITFQDLGISDQICNNLKSMGVEQPTHIQSFGIAQVAKGKRTVVAAETGCGKTLVYLLPIINKILNERRLRRRKIAEPVAIILAPSRELASQIYEVALQLVYNLDVGVKLLQGGNLATKIKHPPMTKFDILVTTTNAIKVLSSTGVAYGLGSVNHLVLDEADTLLDDSFFPELVAPFLNRFPWNDVAKQIQLTLVSATMPKDLDNTLGQIMNTDDFYECTTPGLHRLMPHVPQRFLRLRKSQKPDKIKELIKEDMAKRIPVIIFCNKSETCDWLSNYLNDEGFDNASIHGRMPLKFRNGRVDMYKRGELNLIIATDLASRGIDTVRTQHVINYEFPLYVADYIHRCGRTGRVGSADKCRVTNFISRPGEVLAVNKIERSVRKESVLAEVNANIKKLYANYYGSFVEIEPISSEEENKGKVKRRPMKEEDDSEDEY